MRLRVLPHPEHSVNLDHVVRVQSSLQGTRQALICWGTGPAHSRHSVILADSPFSFTQLIPASTGEEEKITPIITDNRSWPVTFLTLKHSHLCIGLWHQVTATSKEDLFCLTSHHFIIYFGGSVVKCNFI